jgi:hypothetical protein
VASFLKKTYLVEKFKVLIWNRDSRKTLDMDLTDLKSKMGLKTSIKNIPSTF